MREAPCARRLVLHLTALRVLLATTLRFSGAHERRMRERRCLGWGLGLLRLRLFLLAIALLLTVGHGEAPFLETARRADSPALLKAIIQQFVEAVAWVALWRSPAATGVVVSWARQQHSRNRTRYRGATHLGSGPQFLPSTHTLIRQHCVFWQHFMWLWSSTVLSHSITHRQASGQRLDVRARVDDQVRLAALVSSLMRASLTARVPLLRRLSAPRQKTAPHIRPRIAFAVPAGRTSVRVGIVLQV